MQMISLIKSKLTSIFTFLRIVVYKDDMLQAVVPRSAKPFNFQQAYKLSEEMVSMLLQMAIGEISWL